LEGAEDVELELALCVDVDDLGVGESFFLGWQNLIEADTYVRAKRNGVKAWEALRLLALAVHVDGLAILVAHDRVDELALGGARDFVYDLAAGNVHALEGVAHLLEFHVGGGGEVVGGEQRGVVHRGRVSLLMIGFGLRWGLWVGQGLLEVVDRSDGLLDALDVFVDGLEMLG